MGTHPIFESDFDCLTDMLSALIRDHETSQQKSREKIKKLEQRTAQLAAKYAKELSIKLNEPIRRCYQNEKKCDVEIKRVEAETGKLVAINAQWKEKLDAFELALRELGDVQAYTYAIERDTCVLVNATKRILSRQT